MADGENRLDILSEVRRRTAERKQPRLWEMDIALALNERLQAHLAAEAGVIAAAREMVATWNNGYWRHHVADLASALARLRGPEA